MTGHRGRIILSLSCQVDSGLCLVLFHPDSDFLLTLSICRWQDDPMTNLNTAFDVAEKYLDIPKMLDAEGERRKTTDK